jgi:hypothetical protein
MLPNADKPWAKNLARAVILVTVMAAIILAYYLYDQGMLYIPEVTIILLLLLAILPPNLAILYRKRHPIDPSTKIDHTSPHPR